MFKFLKKRQKPTEELPPTEDMNSFSSEDDEDVSEFEFSDSGESLLEYEEETLKESASPYKNHTITSVPLTLETLVERNFNKKYQMLKNILSIHKTSDIYLLLQSNNWDENAVLNKYMEDENLTRKQSGLPITDSNYQTKISRNGLTINNDFMCPICCDDDEQLSAYSLTCGHKYCSDCYKRYINDKLNDGRLIKCPEMSCTLNMSYEDIDKLFGSNEISRELLKKSAKQYIDTNNKKFKWCPAPDCQSLVQSDDNLDGFNTIASIPIVECSAKHKFCFNCNYENHVPLPCALVKLWIKKCIDDSETAHWLNSNTQACPHCKSSIEKNGGCNHMTCRKCKKEFCWICLGDWREHGSQYYKCNRYNEMDSKQIKSKQEENRKSLHRYLFYYNRFRIHESSMKKDEEISLQVENRIRQLQTETYISYIEGQFLSDAAETLLNGRKTLKWTYAFAYYLQKNNFSEILESNQDYLNKVVEDLSKLFETENPKLILKKKSQFINQLRLVQLRQNTLIECANDGVLNGRLLLDSLEQAKKLSF